MFTAKFYTGSPSNWETLIVEQVHSALSNISSAVQQGFWAIALRELAGLRPILRSLEMNIDVAIWTPESMRSTQTLRKLIEDFWSCLKDIMKELLDHLEEPGASRAIIILGYCYSILRETMSSFAYIARFSNNSNDSHNLTLAVHRWIESFLEFAQHIEARNQHSSPGIVPDCTEPCSSPMFLEGRTLNLRGGQKHDVTMLALVDTLLNLSKTIDRVFQSVAAITDSESHRAIMMNQSPERSAQPHQTTGRFNQLAKDDTEPLAQKISDREIEGEILAVLKKQASVASMSYHLESDPGYPK